MFKRKVKKICGGVYVYRGCRILWNSCEKSYDILFPNKRNKVLSWECKSRAGNLDFSKFVIDKHIENDRIKKHYVAKCK